MDTTTKTTLEKYAQVISSEMMAALKESAEERGVSLDMEIALCLMVGMTEPELGQGNSLFNSIIRQKLSESEQVAECKRNRGLNQYLYEVEKLWLILKFEGKLPRNFKESFELIDVKEMTKIIKAELDKENKEDDRE